MKKCIIIVSSLIGFMTRSVTSKTNSDMMFVEQLPMSIKLFVQKNFPSMAIAYAEKKKSKQGTGYVVNLNNGTELYFNVSGNWNMIDCKTDALPVSLIPTKVFDVVDRRFTNAQFVKIVKRNQGCDIVMSNGVVLRLDMNGEVA